MLNPENYYDLSLRSLPGPKRTFAPSEEKSNPFATAQEAVASFTRRVQAIDNLLPLATLKVFGGAVLDCDFNGTTFTHIDSSRLPESFKNTLAHTELRDIDMITFWSPGWVDMQVEFYYGRKLGDFAKDRYHFEYKPEDGLHINNNHGSEVIFRKNRLIRVTPTEISDEEKLQTARFTGQVLDVIDMLLKGEIPNHRWNRRLAHTSRKS